MSRSWVNKLPRFLRRRLEDRKSLQDIIGNTGWLMADRAVRMALGLAVTVWMARYLGPERLGILRYALALVALLGYLTDLGLRGIIVRDIVEKARSEKGEIIGTTFGLKLVAGIVTAGLATAVVWLIRPDDVLTRAIVAVISSSLVFRAFDAIDLWFQSQVRSKYTVRAKTSAFVLGAAVKIVLIIAEAPLVAFAYAVAGEALLGAVGLMLVYQASGERLASWTVSLGRARGLLAQSWPLIISGFGAVVYLKVDQIMLGEMIGEEEVGIYSVAAQLSEVWYFVPSAIAASAFPALLKSRGEDKALYQERLQWLYDALFLMALAIAIPVTFIASPFVTLVFGAAFSAAGSILSVHIWASTFIFLRAALSKWLIAEDLFIFSMVTHGLGAVTNVCANLLLIPAAGGMGAAVATVLSYASASYFALFLHRKTWPAARMMTRAFGAPLRVPAQLMGMRGSAV